MVICHHIYLKIHLISSFFQNPGFSALQSDHTHSWSGIFSTYVTHASGSVIIFVRQGLSFAELSTSSLSSLDPHSDYIGVNIFLNNSSSLSFLYVYAPLICSFPMDSRTNSLSPTTLPSSRNLVILWDFSCHPTLWDSRGTSDPCGKEVFDWVISSDLLPLNVSDTLTLLHRSSPDISFAPSSLVSERCFRSWALITYQFYKPSLFLQSFTATNVFL